MNEKGEYNKASRMTSPPAVDRMNDSAKLTKQHPQLDEAGRQQAYGDSPFTKMASIRGVDSSGENMKCSPDRVY